MSIVPGYAGVGVTAVQVVPSVEISTVPPSYQTVPPYEPVQKSCQLKNVSLTSRPVHDDRSNAGELSAAREHDV